MSLQGLLLWAACIPGWRPIHILYMQAHMLPLGLSRKVHELWKERLCA